MKSSGDRKSTVFGKRPAPGMGAGDRRGRAGNNEEKTDIGRPVPGGRRQLPEMMKPRTMMAKKATPSISAAEMITAVWMVAAISG